MRIRQLRSAMERAELGALLVSSPSNIFYLTGLSQFVHPGDAYFLVTGKKSYLFTSALYADGIADSDDFEMRILSAKNSLDTHLNEIVRHGRVEQVGIESDHVSLSFFSHLKEKIASPLFPTSGVVEKLRVQKDTQELHSIQSACDLTDLAYTHILKKIRRGATERELAFEIELFVRTHGGSLAFPVIAAFGAHAATPHHENSDKKLEKADIVVLLDFGAKVDGYCSDITRCIFIDTPSDAVASTYDSLLAIQEETVEYAKNKTLGSQLSDIATFCEEKLEEECLPPFPHSLGHGLGIDIHEKPRVSSLSDDTLETGVVFTIEPGVYVPGKLGMRIEDTVGVCDKKLTQLTRSPKGKVVIPV